jgi:hypothetical protein
VGHGIGGSSSSEPSDGLDVKLPTPSDETSDEEIITSAIFSDLSTVGLPIILFHFLPVNFFGTSEQVILLANLTLLAVVNFENPSANSPTDLNSHTSDLLTGELGFTSLSLGRTCMHLISTEFLDQ